MDFLQAKSPFLGVMCIPTVAIATKYLGKISSVVSWNSMGSDLKLKRQNPWNFRFQKKTVIFGRR